MIRRFVAAAAVIALLCPTPAAALTATTSFTVSATVLGACLVSATPLVFGNYAGSTLDQTTTVLLTCTGGTTYSVALSNGGNASGGNRRMTDGTNYLTYELYSDSGRTTVWNAAAPVTGTATGLAETLTVYGRIPSAQFTPAGAYTDTIQVTVTY